MAEITTRRQGEIIQTLFRFLRQEPEGVRAKDAIARLEEAMDLSEFEKAYFPNNPDTPRFPKIARFSTINSVKAGWLLKRGGIWMLTEDGEEALDNFQGSGAALQGVAPAVPRVESQPARARRGGVH